VNFSREWAQTPFNAGIKRHGLGDPDRLAAVGLEQSGGLHCCISLLDIPAVSIGYTSGRYNVPVSNFFLKAVVFNVSGHWHGKQHVAAFLLDGVDGPLPCAHRPVNGSLPSPGSLGVFCADIEANAPEPSQVAANVGLHVDHQTTAVAASLLTDVIKAPM